MKRTFSYISAAILVAFMATASGLAAPPPGDHLRAGDAYFARFDDARALAEYTQAVDRAPLSVEALTKASIASMNVGDRLPEDQGSGEVKLGYFKSAQAYAERALAIRPDDSRAHFLFAAALARQVAAMGRKDQVAAANTIKAEVDRAISLDPTNDLAWHSLAFWHRTLAEMGGGVRFFGGLLFGKIPKGSYVEAVNDFEKAIALNPDYCGHHFELARTYLDLKKKDLAASEFMAGLLCSNMTSQCAHFKDEARRELDKLIKSGGVSGTLLAAYASQNADR